jgi:hypothetical protein
MAPICRVAPTRCSDPNSRSMSPTELALDVAEAIDFLVAAIPFS